MADLEVGGVVCGACGGSIYMETCGMNGGPEGCEWAVASECQACGSRHEMSCPDHQSGGDDTA